MPWLAGASADTPRANTARELSERPGEARAHSAKVQMVWGAAKCVRHRLEARATPRLKAAGTCTGTPAGSKRRTAPQAAGTCTATPTGSKRRTAPQAAGTCTATPTGSRFRIAPQTAGMCTAMPVGSKIRTLPQAADTCSSPVTQYKCCRRAHYKCSRPVRRGALRFVWQAKGQPQLTLYFHR
jgi:hypothetical protein